MSIGGFVKETCDGEKNRMMLSNSHRKVLASFNAQAKEIDALIAGAKKAAPVQSELYTKVLFDKIKDVNGAIKRSKNLNNSSLKKGKLFEINRKLAYIVNITFLGDKGKPTPAIYELFKNIYGNESLAKSKYDNLVDTIEDNYKLIEQGNTEKSSLETSVRKIAERPFKSAVKAGAMFAGMGTLGILSPYIGGAADKAMGAYEENREASGRGPGMFAGWSSESGSGGSTSSKRSSARSGSSDSGSGSSRGSGGFGGASTGGGMSPKAFSLGLFEFFNKDAFQAKWTADLYTKVMAGAGIGGKSGGIGDLFSNIGSKAGKIVSNVGGMAKNAIGVGSKFLGAAPGSVAAGGVLGTTAAVSGAALAGWGTGRLIGKNVKVGGKSVDEHTSGFFGNILNKFTRGKETDELKSADKANAERLAKFKAAGGVVPSKTEPLAKSSITTAGAIDKPQINKNAKGNELIDTVYGQKMYRDAKTGKTTTDSGLSPITKNVAPKDSNAGVLTPEQIRNLGKAEQIKRERGEQISREVKETLANPEAAAEKRWAFSSAESLKQIKEMNEKLAKLGDTKSATAPKSNPPSRSKSTGNPHMDYINMGLMGPVG